MKKERNKNGQKEGNKVNTYSKNHISDLFGSLSFIYIYVHFGSVSHRFITVEQAAYFSQINLNCISVQYNTNEFPNIQN